MNGVDSLHFTLDGHLLVFGLAVLVLVCVGYFSIYKCCYWSE